MTVKKLSMSWLCLLCLGGCLQSQPPEPQAQAAPKEPAVPREQAAPTGAPPGSPERGAALRQRLEAASVAQGAPGHGHHLDAQGQPLYTNRLILEKSPYLLQHAHNPVDWWPWGPEAFAQARQRGLPVLLSVGYATCHWCHVMERESFEDVEIAAFINRNFIPIKVDRERRPDVDAVYMDAVRMLTGGGGWPMTVVMTPDKEPFFAGTYFPARDGDRGARQGFLSILQELSRRHREEPGALAAEAAALSQRLKRAAAPAPSGRAPDGDTLYRAAALLARDFDPSYGGFGRSRKFPRPSALSLLLQYHRRTGDPEALRMVTQTLDHMADGGIHDQVGGGFHRYTVERAWRIPHFEKMLYDNALLAVLYLEAWRVTGQPRYREVARRTLDYMDREMSHPEGGFYSASDADSLDERGHSHEGLFFTWTPEELRRRLTTQEAALVMDVYGVSERGNFEGRTVLARRRAPTAQEEATLKVARQKLYQVRQGRPAPLVDTKVLASWNGMAIAAFAQAGRALGEPRYLERAIRAATFVRRRMWSGGAMHRVFMQGEASHRGVLDDYAWMVAALLDLFEATGQERWLTWALAIEATMERDFGDGPRGGFFLAAGGTDDLLTREKPDYDGAEPSGNAVAARNLMRLATLTGEDRWRRRAQGVFEALSGAVRRYPTSAPALLQALDFYLDEPLELVLVEPEGAEPEGALRRAFLGAYLPNGARLVARAGVEPGPRVPWIKEKVALRGSPTAYVCRRGVCQRPTTQVEVFKRQLGQAPPYEPAPAPLPGVGQRP